MLEEADIDDLSKIHISTYINSLIISYQLFDIYMKESNKSNLLTLIKKILQDEMSVEDLLEKLDISYESSLENILKKTKEEKFYV